MPAKRRRKTARAHHTKQHKNKKFKLFFVPGVAGGATLLLTGAIGLAVAIFGAALAGNWYMHNKKGR